MFGIDVTSTQFHEISNVSNLTVELTDLTNMIMNVTTKDVIVKLWFHTFSACCIELSLLGFFIWLQSISILLPRIS